MKKRRSINARIIDFFSDIYKTIRFYYHYFRRNFTNGKCTFPYKQTSENNSIRVLATGPSLNKEIEQLRQDGTLFSDQLFVMNLFAFSDLFIEIKPQRYCLADPGFFRESYLSDKVNQLFEILNSKVTWKMSLYIPNISISKARTKIQNKNIDLITVPTFHFEGFESKRNKYYKKGIATPSYVNVLIMIEYICLNEGFSKIYLYGADHTFLSNLMVDDNNVLKIGDSHFYGNATVARCHPDGTPYRVSEFIYDKYLTFIEHDIMRRYADFLGAEIINCTKCSLIDSYVRLSQLKEDK